MNKTEELKACSFGKGKYYVDALTGCWIWVGAKTGRGYGNLVIDGRNKLAHRVSYEHAVGLIPKGLNLHHRCRNRPCINPDHLRPMTQKENNLCSESLTALNTKKTICKNGHSLFGAHIRIRKRSDGVRRHCKLCDAIYKRRKNERISPCVA